jgi:hypothetical protein
MGQSESQRPVKSTQSWFIQRVPHLAAPALCLLRSSCSRPSPPPPPRPEKKRQASTRSGVTLIEPRQLNRISTRSTRVAAPASTGWDRIQLSCRSYRQISSPSTRLFVFSFSLPPTDLDLLHDNPPHLVAHCRQLQNLRSSEYRRPRRPSYDNNISKVEAAPYLHRPSSCTRSSPGTIGPPAQFTLQPTFFDQLRNYPLLCFFFCLIVPRSLWKNSVVDRKTTTVGQLKLYEDDGLIVCENKAQKRLRIVNENLVQGRS